jgi:hypothetical protein
MVNAETLQLSTGTAASTSRAGLMSLSF